MGCAPSHSEIIQHLAKNTLRPLKKATALASADKTQAESRTHSISGGSGNSDSDSNISEEGQENTSWPGSKEDWRQAERGRCQTLPPSTVPARMPKLYNEEKKREKLAAGVKVAVSEVIVSQKYVPQEMPVQKQHTYSDSNTAQQPKRTRKQKGRQASKQTKSAKLRAKSHSRAEDEEKVDFPTSLVKAHQAAYAYLNPSLSKYDAVLSLTEQAAQTQLMLQQMVSFLTLRFEEVNQILEEIASEGERLVKDVGPHLAWPVEKGGPKDQPDLLQQLLQYTVNKMQATNGTVISLTATTLQEACGYLQSAADTFQKRLAVKQQVDGRLQRMIAQLESCAWQQSHPKPGDTALYSEDSGIGADTDSMKEYCNPDKCARRLSYDSNAYLLCRDSLPHTFHRQTGLSHAAVCTSKSHDCTLDRQLKGIFHSSHGEKALSSQSSVSVSTFQSSLMQNRSFDSFESVTSTDCEALVWAESMDFYSLGEEDDEESDSEITAEGMPQRPRSSPPETKAVRPAPKRIDVPENEEMTIKIKDAISDKIQFVPITSGSNVWSDEESKLCPVRPSSAKGCKTRVRKKRRSRSAESLKSKAEAEDPTLLELQRTQKDLSRRLEKMLQPKDDNKGVSGQRETVMPKLPANLPSAEQAAPTSKLKASLHSNFSILPSQEKVLLKRNTPGTGSQAKTKAAPSIKHDPANAKENQGPPEPCAGKGSAAQPQRNCAQGPMDNLSWRDDDATAGDPGGTRRISAPTFPLLPPAETGPGPEEFPPPPLEVAIDGVTTESVPRHTCAEMGTGVADAGALVTVGAYTCAGEGTGEVAAEDACAVKEAAVSRVTVTQRLLASLDTAALLPSKHPGGRINLSLRAARSSRRPAVPEAQGRSSQDHIHSAESQRRLKATGWGGQNWPPYKIINLRYAGASCSSPENGAAQQLPEHGRLASSPRRQAETEAETEAKAEAEAASPSTVVRQHRLSAASPPSSPATLSKLTPAKLTPHSPPRERKHSAGAPSPLSHLLQATGGPAPAPTPSPPAERKSFSSPPLPPRNLYRPAGYTSLSPSAARRCPNPVWGPQQPSPPATQVQLRPLVSPRRSGAPVPRKVPSPPAHCQLHSPPAHHQPPSLPAHRQPPSPPAHRQLPSSPAHRQLPSPPAHRQPPSPPAHRQPLSPPAHCQPPSPPAHRQPPSPPVHRQLPSPPAHRQPPSPPAHRQLPSPPAHRQLPSPPTHRQPLSPPVPSPLLVANAVSPPVVQRKRPPDHPEVARESQCPGKFGSNASSIFCPLSNSIFESQPPSPPVGTVNAAAPLQNIILGDNSPMMSRAVWRNSFMLRQPGDRQRRLTLSGVHPQPFVKKNYLPDFKTGAQSLLPTSGSGGSEPTLNSVGLGGNFENEDNPWTRNYVSELRGSSRSISHPELCIIGQGLQ
ncbi:photoreceptor cilium actin regulator-like [Heterodontus francisci]|uniref:photoreceptor cilium actin regulator-like n=1 Tax=Heterodontus francisci TaxID=7792 RepID=UPI00355C0EFC